MGSYHESKCAAQIVKACGDLLTWGHFDRLFPRCKNALSLSFGQTYTGSEGYAGARILESHDTTCIAPSSSVGWPPECQGARGALRSTEMRVQFMEGERRDLPSLPI
jgi:hypothetical protein